MMDNFQLVACIAGLLLTTSLRVLSQPCHDESVVTPCDDMAPEIDGEFTEEKFEKFCNNYKDKKKCYEDNILPNCKHNRGYLASQQGNLDKQTWECETENRAAYVRAYTNINSTCLVNEAATEGVTRPHLPFELLANESSIPDEKVCKEYADWFRLLNERLESYCKNDIAVLFAGSFRREWGPHMVMLGCQDPRPHGIQRKSSASSLTWEAFKIVALLRIADLVVSVVSSLKSRVFFG